MYLEPIKLYLQTFDLQTGFFYLFSIFPHHTLDQPTPRDKPRKTGNLTLSYGVFWPRKTLASKVLRKYCKAGRDQTLESVRS